MDSKGIFTVDFIFAIFLSLIILIIGLNMIGNNLNDEITMEEDFNSRILLDKVANTINQVNSNSLGYIQEISIPNNISKRSFSITVKQNEVMLEFTNKKAESTIFPIRMTNINNDNVNETRLYPGESYKIKKSLDKDNLTVIQIYKA